ncbi:MAG TPA: trypsin-like peptidase domain-containing protein [Polyangiaceae bacterium]
MAIGPRGFRRAGGVAVIAALALVAACKRPGSSGSGSEGDLPSGAVPVAPAPVTPPPALPAASPTLPGAAGVAGQGAPMSFAPIAHRADPSVVTITTREVSEEESPFFGRVRERETQGLGTGFLVDKDGVILTNNHVVEHADQINVKLSDDRTFPAKVVGTDPPTDIAVIRIAASGFAPLPLGDSDSIDVGDWVVAIGNPFGLAHTVSAGIISAKGRTIADVPLDPAGYYNFLQTDASINPGNSGGPLLNLKGDVVGMNTAIRGGGAQNIGFAIPINMVKQLLPMLLRDGHVTRSALGVVVRSVKKLAPEDRAQHKIPDDHGVVIFSVSPGGPADKAGIVSGDVILAFDGEPVDQDDRLKWLASVAGVGREVTLRMERESKVFDLKVGLGLLRDPQQPGERGRGRP